MGGIKVLFILLFLNTVDFSLTQGCTCGVINIFQHQIEDTTKEIVKYTGFANLKDVTSAECKTEPIGKEFIDIKIDDDTSFTLSLQNVKELEESSKNSENIKLICVKLKIECVACEQQQEIEFTVKDTNNNLPKFINEDDTTTSEYVYTFPMPTFPSASVENFGMTIRAKDIDMTNMKIDFSIENNDFIDIKYVGIDSKDPLTKTHIAVLTVKSMMYFETNTYKITALDQDGEPVHADLIINRNPSESIQTSKFKEPYYEGKCDVAGVCVKDIKLDSETADYITISGGENKEFFEFDSRTSSIILKGDIEQITKEFVVLLLEAKPPLQLVPVNAIASIAIPKSSGGTPELIFKPHPASFSLKSTDVEDIYTFEATSSNRRDTVRFSIKGNIPNGIAMKETGVLHSTDTVPSGRHDLVILAESDVSDLEAEASVVLNVLNFDIDDGKVRADQSFVIMNIKEGNPTEVFITGQDLQDLGYKYRILNQYPDKDMFEETTDGSVTSKSLDREADYFTGFKLPQFTLMLELQKDSRAFRSNHTRTVRDTRDNDYNMVEGINMFKALENHPLRTAVVVVVEDTNDHTPDFGVAEIMVCYPNEKIVYTVKPSYLIQVQATDPDSPDGEGFGKITYSTESSEVAVDKSNGVIYPTEDIFKQDSTTFTVTATDGGGEKAELTVKVNLVDENQIGELTLNNVPFEKLDDELKKLSETAGFDISTFSIPVNPYEKASSSRAGNYQLRVFIYALKNKVIVGVDEMKERLGAVKDVELKPFVPNTCNGNGNGNESSDSGETTDTTGLIAAVSVLSVLLVLFIIGAGALWYFKFRPNLLDMSNDYYEEGEAQPAEQKTTRFEKNSALITPQPPPTRRLTAYPGARSIPEDDDDGNASNRSSLGNISLNKDAADSASSYDYLSNAVDKVDSNTEPELDDQKAALERKKSVTFKAAIEKIEIEKTADNDEDDDEDDDNTSENDSDDDDEDDKNETANSNKINKTDSKDSV